jgi:hypothetical protein
MRKAIAVALLLALSGCATTAPRAISVSTYQPTAAPVIASSFVVVNTAGETPRRSPTTVSPDVSEFYSPRFSEAIADGLQAHLSARLSGSGEPTVRASVLDAEVTVERGGSDFLPIVGGISATLRTRTFVASGSILLEVERGGQVERSYVLRHTTRIAGGLATDAARGQSTASAINQWRTEAFAKLDTEFLARYLSEPSGGR